MKNLTAGGIRLSILVSAFLAAAPVNAEEVVMDKVAPTIIDRLIVEDGPWQQADVETMLRQFYLASRTRYRLFRLTVAPNKNIGYRALTHGSGTASFENTVLDLKQQGLPLGPVGQVLGFGGSAVMLFRDGEVYSKRVLGDSSDPTIFHLKGGHTFQLLAFWLTISRQGHPRLYSLTISVRSQGSVSLGACAGLTEMLGSALDPVPISVDVRPDEWFLESAGFPALYPFTKQLRIPSETEYRLASQVLCGYDKRHGVTCSGHSFKP